MKTTATPFGMLYRFPNTTAGQQARKEISDKIVDAPELPEGYQSHLLNGHQWLGLIDNLGTQEEAQVFFVDTIQDIFRPSKKQGPKAPVDQAIRAELIDDYCRRWGVKPDQFNLTRSVQPASLD